MSLIDTFVRRAKFLGEQDGPPEQAFKAALQPILLEAGVQRAYLVRVRYGLFGSSVALCLQTGGTAADEERIVKAVDAVLSGLEGGPLDIMFLSDSRERDVAAVCPSFLVHRSM